LKIDPYKVEVIIAEVADSIILPKFRKLSGAEIREKSGPSDLVTLVDEAAESALREGLKGIDPHASFVGEESAAKDPKVLDALKGDGAVWIVDPIDGTRNFVNGVEEFGAIVAYVLRGVPRFGWVYAIPERKCAIVEKGAGAEWAGASIAIQAEPAAPRVHRSLGALTQAKRDFLLQSLRNGFVSVAGHCSAYSYLKLARGEVDLKISTLINPWDHVAGSLLVEELGGRSAFLYTGEQLRPSAPSDRPLLVAAPGRDWDMYASRILSASDYSSKSDATGNDHKQGDRESTRRITD